MSARPALALLPPEDLDLLISRSLDGDLAPEEMEELERYLASSAEARHRREALSDLVRSVRELPAPEPPFALATRVNAQVEEHAQATASAWNRFGLYPPPGVVPFVAFLVVVGIVVAALTGGRPPRPQPAPSSDEREAPVRVFFTDSAATLSWSVDVVGTSAGWRLASVPALRPESAVDATYRLALDASGRVTLLRPTAPGANVRPDVAQLLRGLVFERTGPAGTPREVDVHIVAR